AVLEAMRGRADAAREILASGRATLEELGLTLELHELAMHAGIVELLTGEPAAAENLLRSARDGFAALGVSVSAAQAAALLARALVETGRGQEALAETEYAEQHAGGDLKTTITWLGARAEALAGRGDLDAALTMARRADEASTAAENARLLYRMKDHTVGVQRASELLSVSLPPASTVAETSDS